MTPTGGEKHIAISTADAGEAGLRAEILSSPREGVDHRTRLCDLSAR